MDRRQRCPGSNVFDAGRNWRTTTGGLSREALQLHVYAVLASIEAGRAGLVTDDYLGAVHVDTTLPVLELCAERYWDRVQGGYRVPEDETIRIAEEVHRQLEGLALLCRASGGHQADPDAPGVCGGCGVHLA